MTRKELISKINVQGISEKKLTEIIKAYEDGIVEALKGGEAVRLSGFGTWEISERAERKGINPATKETITIPASRIPKFHPGKSFKEAIK